MHFTADRPLAADVEVLIVQGRPWFAYPRPDDFTLANDWITGSATPPVHGGPTFWRWAARQSAAWDEHQVPLGPLTYLIRLIMPNLHPTAEGYPWLRAAPPRATVRIRAALLFQIRAKAESCSSAFAGKA